MTRSKNQRWGSRRKREVAASILSGEKTKAAVLLEYPDISEEELDTWITAYKRSGGSSAGMSMSAMIRDRKLQTA